MTKTAGTHHHDRATGIAVGADGNIWITGFSGVVSMDRSHDRDGRIGNRDVVIKRRDRDLGLALRDFQLSDREFDSLERERRERDRRAGHNDREINRRERERRDRVRSRRGDRNVNRDLNLDRLGDRRHDHHDRVVDILDRDGDIHDREFTGNRLDEFKFNYNRHKPMYHLRHHGRHFNIFVMKFNSDGTLPHKCIYFQILNSFMFIYL